MKRCNSSKLCQFVRITKTLDVTNFLQNFHYYDNIYTKNSCKRTRQHLIHFFQHLVYFSKPLIIVL